MFILLQSTPVGTTIFRNIQAQDKDAGVNGLVEYFLVEGLKNVSDITPDTLTAADGFGTFAISYPHQGQVKYNATWYINKNKLHEFNRKFSHKINAQFQIFTKISFIYFI